LAHTCWLVDLHQSCWTSGTTESDCPAVALSKRRDRWQRKGT